MFYPGSVNMVASENMLTCNALRRVGYLEEDNGEETSTADVILRCNACICYFDFEWHTFCQENTTTERHTQNRTNSQMGGVCFPSLLICYPSSVIFILCIYIMAIRLL